MRHCIETIAAIIDQNRDDRRSILQLGYNLGRLSELTGLGREPFWDRWKEPIATWDLKTLKTLASELLQTLKSDPHDAEKPTNPPAVDASSA